MKMIIAAMGKGEVRMIKLHADERIFDIWINEKQIVSMEYAASKNGTQLFLQNGTILEVTETPEEILALMGETAQLAPAKNNITKWIENIDEDVLENTVRDNMCSVCSANDRCCQYGLTGCAETIKRWALEASE